MKASEHFNLPLSAGDHEVIAERVYQDLDYDHIAEFNSPEQAQIAARCINHADKLADALASMLVEHSRYQLPNKTSLAAAIILEAYRSAE